MKSVDPYSPLPLTAMNLLKTGPLVQPESLGPKALKVRIPTGEKPPAIVAVSWIAPPSVPSVATVEIVGVALVTVEVSPGSPQAEVTGLLSASPE